MKISIITPNLNGEDFLSENIQSVSDQHVPSEHIVIDGGSTDASIDILKKSQHMLSFWSSESDTGQSNAINKGFIRSTGDAINWINGDDYLEPGALAFVRNFFLSHPEVDVLCGSSRLIRHPSTFIKLAQPQPVHNQLNHYSGIFFPQPSAFVRRKASLLVEPLSESLHYGMDYEYYLKLFLLGSKFEYSSTSLSVYRLHTSSKTSTCSLGFAEDWIQVYNNFIQDEKNSKSIIEVLKTLGLFRFQTSSYKRLRYLSSTSLFETLLYSLHAQFCFRAEGGDASTARNLAKYLLLNKFPSRNSLAYLKKLLSNL